MKPTTLQIPALLLILCLAGPAPVHADDTLDSDALAVELREMAKDIKAVVDKKGGGNVAVGEFSGSARIKGSSGPEIQLKLAQALTDLKVPLSTDEYRFEVVGSYGDFKHPERKILGVRVVGRVTDSTDFATLAEFPRFVFGQETVPRMLGLSVKTSHNADADERSRNFEKALKDQPTEVANTKISNGGEYAIEILVRQTRKYVPRAANRDSRGRVFVPIKHDEVYAVRLINNSKHEAAVALTIDGVNSFEFNEDTPKPKFWLVSAGKSTDILGWDKNTKKSIEFKVTEFPETAAARIHLQTSSTIGTITAAFSAAWTSDKDKPSDEAIHRGTGFGDEITDEKTSVKRFVGGVRDTIAVRYER